MNLKEKLRELRDKLTEEKQEKSNEKKDIKFITATAQEKKWCEDIRNFRKNRYKVTPLEENMYRYISSIEPISLSSKIDDFIVQNSNGTYGQCNHNELEDIRNFIEKMAVWFELRYPDYEINKLMPGSGVECIDINDVMFNSNKYINDLLDQNSDVRELDWNEFYNIEAFIKSLPWKEKCFLQNPKYQKLVYLDPNYKLIETNYKTGYYPKQKLLEAKNKSAHFHLSSDGFIERSVGISSYSNNKINDDELKGMHIKKALQLLKEKNVVLPSNNELEKTVENVENLISKKEGILNCVMYRIIERGGIRIGPRRALLFAKELNRNIDIPMIYGVDYSDPGLRSFINEYIKAGGSKDLICYVGYFSKTAIMENLDMVSIQELIKEKWNNCINKYTPEETMLHQRFVNALTSQVDYGNIKKEKVKQLRLQRKLQKSKNKNH